MSEIFICNKALQKLGRARISSLTEDSENAREASFAYDAVRKEALTAADWRFAGKRRALAKDSVSPIWEYANRYQLPSDCLRVRKVKTSCPWEQVGNYIQTDADAPLYISYTEDTEDTTVFSPNFVNFFATMLAIELVEQLTQSGTAQDRLRDRLRREASDLALMADADQGSPDEPEEDDWIKVRL